MFQAFLKFDPIFIHAWSLLGRGILPKILSKYFPTCSDFKTTTNSISSKCKLSTSSTTLFNWKLIDQLLLPYTFYGSGVRGIYFFFHFCQLWAVNLCRLWRGALLTMGTLFNSSRLTNAQRKALANISCVSPALGHLQFILSVECCGEH